MRTRLAMSVAFAVAATLMVAGGSPAAEAIHLRLEKSTPAADAVVAQSPAKIVLDFSEGFEMAVSKVTIKGVAGEVKLGKLARHEEDETIMWAAIEAPLDAGVYSVNWVTSSGDGHPVRGDFDFTVKAAR